MNFIDKLKKIIRQWLCEHDWEVVKGKNYKIYCICEKCGKWKK